MTDGRKKLRLIVIAIVVILVFVGLFNSLVGKNFLNPKAYYCELKGGKWLVGTFTFGQSGCLYYYSDGGKECLSSKDCRGECVMVNGAKNNSEGYLVGQCKNNSLPLGTDPGCFYYIGDASGNVLSDALDKPTKFDAKKLRLICY